MGGFYLFTLVKSDAPVNTNGLFLMAEEHSARVMLWFWSFQIKTYEPQNSHRAYGHVVGRSVVDLCLPGSSSLWPHPGARFLEAGQMLGDPLSGDGGAGQVRDTKVYPMAAEMAQ